MRCFWKVVRNRWHRRSNCRSLCHAARVWTLEGPHGRDLGRASQPRSRPPTTAGAGGAQAYKVRSSSTWLNKLCLAAGRADYGHAFPGEYVAFALKACCTAIQCVVCLEVQGSPGPRRTREEGHDVAVLAGADTRHVTWHLNDVLFTTCAFLLPAPSPTPPLLPRPTSTVAR